MSTDRLQALRESPSRSVRDEIEISRLEAAATMTRSEMLDAIIKDDIDTVKHARNGTEVLIELLYQGFSGYSNYTDQMLTDEVKGRGLYE